MKQILILQCSPKKNGVTDTFASIFSSGAKKAGAIVTSVALREYTFQACTGCGCCYPAPHRCVFWEDGAETIFSFIINASLVIFCFPIYFYGAPAHLKALIDRGQRFWAANLENRYSPSHNPTPTVAIMSAGRSRGNLLFDGAKRSLRFFLECMNAQLIESHEFRGLENPVSITSQIEDNIFQLGYLWGGKMVSRASGE